MKIIFFFFCFSLEILISGHLGMAIAKAKSGLPQKTPEKLLAIEKMKLSVEYPEKISQFVFERKDQRNQPNEMIFTVEGNLRKKRSLSSKDLQWLSKTVSSVDFSASNPGGKCRVGAYNLSIEDKKNEKWIRKCIGALDGETQKLVSLINTLYTFL